MTNSKAISLKLIDEHSILLKQQNQNSFIKYQNHKIIFVSNNRGNITLLNNVLNAKFISNHKGIIGVFLRIGSRRITMTNHFTYNYKGFISIYTMLIFIIYLSIISFYTTQYSLKLKTIHNINSYYDLKINQLFEKG